MRVHALRLQYLSGHAAAKRASELESRLHECSTGLIKLKDQVNMFVSVDGVREFMLTR